MSPKCTAPTAGHSRASAAANCPVHGVRVSGRDVPASAPVSPETQARLARHRNVWVRRRVAEDPNAPPEVLLLLAADDDIRVRFQVAGNPSAPPGALALLAGDRGTGQRLRVAEHPSTPGETLMMLRARDKASEVRVAAAASVDARICGALGVDESNADALEALRDEEWWDMTPESPAVVVALALSPNA